MNNGKINANQASPVPGQAWDDGQAVERIVVIAKTVGSECDGLGLKDEDRKVVIHRRLVVLNTENMLGRFDSAKLMADALRRGSPKAKAYAAEIEDALQMRLPFADGSTVEPAKGNESPNAGIVKARDSVLPLPDAAAAPAPQPEPQAAVPVAITYGENDPAKVSDLKTQEPFSGLFPVLEKTVAVIAEDMRKHGYDRAKPVTAWAGRDIVIDGHTRLEAARRAGLTEIPVVFRDFASEDEALEYAIHEQSDRRNLTDAVIFRLVAELDKRRGRGGDRRSEDAQSKTSGEVSGPSSETTASLIGTSATKVENARAVLGSEDRELRAGVETGSISLRKAAVKVRAAKKPVKRPDHVKAAEKAAATLNALAAELREYGNMYSGACDKLAALATELQETAKADNAEEKAV